MTYAYRSIFRMFAVIVLLAGGWMPLAHAEDDDDDKYVSTVSNAEWQAECGACHVAYPPRLLPAESWQAVMSGLNDHFGSDAGLDAPTARAIGAFLGKHAGNRKQNVSGKPVMRITETRWFKREHDEVSDRTWKNPKVKSAANCAACHTQAENGNYSERNIRIPR